MSSLTPGSFFLDCINIRYYGKIVKTRLTKELILAPIHPYINYILYCSDMVDLSIGYAFEPRCKSATEICKREKHKMIMYGTIGVRCHNALEGKYNEKNSRCGKSTTAKNWYWTLLWI